ncbi:MAG: DUF302 domain-containing protein [Bacteroidetes bacterium]|nr:DUF302 domain-containing protein [Bacteroidota bacterium]
MENLLIEKRSASTVEETANRIVAEAEKNNWKIPVVHDLQQTLAKNGRIVRPVKVIEICKPEYSASLLELNHERAISVMMPCRISVYEKEDGIAYVALMNTASMGQGMPDIVTKVMSAAAKESEYIVDEALKE